MRRSTDELIDRAISGYQEDRDGCHSFRHRLFATVLFNKHHRFFGRPGHIVEGSGSSQSLQSQVTAGSAPAQLAPDTYTPGHAAASGGSSAAQAITDQRGPETTLDGNTLAKDQVISASLNVRLALLQAEDSYHSSKDQAWSTLIQSLASGDIAGAQTALTAYTQALPTDPESLSPLTSPSAQFLDDLSTVGSALQSGNIAAARSEFQAAEYAAPDGATGVFSLAYDTGNTPVEAAIQAEAVAADTAALTSLGYTPVNAKLEATIISIAAVAGPDYAGNSQPQSSQTDQWIVDLAKDVVSGPQPTAIQANGTSSNPFYKIITSLLTLASPSDLNKTLAILVGTYGAGGSSNGGSLDNPSGSGRSASSADVSVYA